jgi:hypothetical protein
VLVLEKDRALERQALAFEREKREMREAFEREKQSALALERQSALALERHSGGAIDKNQILNDALSGFFRNV